MTKIICPNCESIESASVEYFHECSNCGYIITDSDWQEVEDEHIACIHRINRGKNMKRILGTYMFPLKQFVCDCCEKECAVTSSKSSKLPAGWIEVNENHYCSACVKRDQQIREAATIASKKFRYRDLHIPAMSGFVEGAKWADKHSKDTWISVEEMLPNINKCGESKMVFVRVINKDTKAEWIEQPAKYNINIKDWIAMDFTHIGKRNGMVTHWMPIPKLQEE